MAEGEGDVEIELTNPRMDGRCLLRTDEENVAREIINHPSLYHQNILRFKKVGARRLNGGSLKFFVD
ncbi:Serine/threonine-protein kinase SRK2G [Platanthera guangdongensis]|uniref:Serine/threonine-protein kinase SRK2G n=1 Tax=Platanthera guangdongensis TaxID=2320717 RepID=A0ABR2MP54_9ASPA